MTKVLYVDRCTQCPHFIPSDSILRHWREHCRLNAKKVPYDLKTGTFPVPDHCELHHGEKPESFIDYKPKVLL